MGIRFPNGGVGEVIVIEPRMNEAKFERGGHTIYEAGRAFMRFAEKDGKILNKAAHDAEKKFRCLTNMVYAGEDSAPSYKEFSKQKSECLDILKEALSDPEKYGLPKGYFSDPNKGERHTKTWRHIIENWADVAPAARNEKSAKPWSA